MSENTVATAVTLAIGENGSKIHYFSHSACTAHPLCTPPPPYKKHLRLPHTPNGTYLK